MGHYKSKQCANDAAKPPKQRNVAAAGPNPRVEKTSRARQGKTAPAKKCVHKGSATDSCFVGQRLWFESDLCTVQTSYHSMWPLHLLEVSTIAARRHRFLHSLQICRRSRKALRHWRQRQTFGQKKSKSQPLPRPSAIVPPRYFPGYGRPRQRACSFAGRQHTCRGAPAE